MDGVLADFDTGYDSAFGQLGGKDADAVDWSKVRAVSCFILCRRRQNEEQRNKRCLMRTE